jgi:uridine nucleosidase
VFGITEGPPLHDPIAVAAVLTGIPLYEIPMYDYNQEPGSSSVVRERYEVTVITDGTHEEALAGLAQTGRTLIRLLEPGEEGVRIPRSIDIPRFWSVLEECVQRADKAA